MPTMPPMKGGRRGQRCALALLSLVLILCLSVFRGSGTFVSKPQVTPRLSPRSTSQADLAKDGAQGRPARSEIAEIAEVGTLPKATEEWLSSLPNWVWRGVILVLCMLWATNFAVIKEITAQPGVTTQMYAVSRFTVAAGLLSPWISQASSPKVLARAVECGAWIAFGYIGQAVGLMTTTASKSCFICTLNVVFVSLIVGITKKKFDPQTVMAAALAVTGVGFLELAGSQQFVIGDLISLAMPVGFGMGYIRLEEIMAENPKDALPVTAVKLGVVAAASWAYYALTTGSPDLEPVLASSTALTGILYTGLVTTGLALVVESVAFRFIDATSASVIFTTEPLWAAIFAVWLINEPFSAVDAIGGALVIGANVIKELPEESLPWNTATRAAKTAD
ncbi:hypothetical protein AK812_SmicGene35847 [Symbiodinium microadriaticum]|uniref:EamA domain-containing protein n=1 Tax=Symbiodinium microadriaticum TaxID=2951 RepID=A0A1Q9CKD5_SYMMI|nr:hypothetical protein AK812_SmicGene35847 [Symbiodinium microadriaticum]